MAERLCYSTSMAIAASIVSTSSKLAVTRSQHFSSLSLSSFHRLAFSLRSSSRISTNPIRVSQQKMNRGMGATCAALDVSQLRAAREDIRELLTTQFCHPILVRLGWHDAGTYDKNIEEWPQRGGANGSLRYEVELKHAANAGLINAIKLIQPLKDKYPGISYADLFQLASATAIEEAGGPKIPMKYGRVDVSAPEQCPVEGKLPVVEMAEQNVQRRDRRSPRIWSSHAMSEFFRIAADAYQAAGKSKKGIHKKILIELNEALVNVSGESPFTVEQITAKYDALKKKWVVWRNLRNKTGAGWDNARGTISGSELWWIDRQAEFGNSILKYKRQPIQNLNELEQIFSNSVATGEAAFTPGTTVNPQQSPQSPAAEDVTQSYFDQQWGVPLEDINTQLPFRQPTQTSGSGSSSKVRSSRRRRTENEEKMNELVDMMYEKHKNKKNRSETDSPSSNPSTNASNSPYANTSSQPTSPISDLRTTIERVKKFEDIELSKAISLLQIKENRDTLTFLEDDDAREWLRYEIEKTNLAMRYQNYLLSMPPQYPPQFPPTFPPPYPPQFPPTFTPQYPPQ